MKWNITFRGVVEKFPSSGGWYYVAVPTKYTKSLKQKRKAWGMYPITVRCGNTTWKTKCSSYGFYRKSHERIVYVNQKEKIKRIYF